MEGVACPPVRALRVWSPLPYRSATRRTLARATRSGTPFSIQRARAPHAYFAAPVRGRRAAYYPSGVRGKARIVGRVLQSSSADRAESLGL
jgi:hypothetical protein